MISPYDMFGSLTSRFLYGTEPSPLPKHSKKHNGTWPNAKQLAELCISDDVPNSVLPRANDVWRITRPEEYSGNSYKSIDPMTFANQKKMVDLFALPMEVIS